MNIVVKNIFFLLIGSSTSFLLAWFLIIRKFILFINNEIEHNETYRLNAKNDLKQVTSDDEHQLDCHDQEL